MMKVKIKAFLHYHKYDWEEAAEYVYLHSDYSTISSEYALVRVDDLEVEIPDDFDPRPQQIDNLKAAKAEVLAKAHVQAQNIEDQIQRLLCIDHKPDAQQ